MTLPSRREWPWWLLIVGNLAVAASLLISVAAHAESRDAGVVDAGMSVESLYVKCPDAPFAEEVDGGLFEPWLRVKRNNCRQAACESYASAKLIDDKPTGPGTVLLLIGGGAAVALLFFLFGFLLPRSKP